MEILCAGILYVFSTARTRLPFRNAHFDACNIIYQISHHTQAICGELFSQFIHRRRVYGIKERCEASLCLVRGGTPCLLVRLVVFTGDGHFADGKYD